MLIILCGVSATGKTTIANHFIKNNFKKTISYTTRKKRINETENIDYHFISHNEFLEKIANDEFLEYTQQFDNYYGTLKKDIQNFDKNSKIILCISLSGYLKAKEIWPDDTIGFYLMPPDEIELTKRLNLRENNENEIRLKNIYEISQRESKFFDHVLLPDTLENTIKKIENSIYNILKK